MAEFVNGKVVQTAVYLIREVGITTVVIGVFLGMFTGYLNSPMTETKALMILHSDATIRIQTEQIAVLEELLRTQRATCVIQAKTESDRRLCLK